MAYRQLEFRTRPALVARSTQAVREAVQACGRASVIVPSFTWAGQRKLQFMHERLGGVGVDTLANWTSALWDLYGDGSHMVTGGQRMALARPLLAQMLESAPSHGMLGEFCAFLQEAVSTQLAPHGDLSATEAALVELAARYRAQLADLGLVELATAQDVLVAAGVDVGAVVVEEPALQPRDRRFLEALGNSADVLVLTRSVTVEDADAPDVPGVPEVPELAQLSRALYTGRGGVRATGAVAAGEAHGAHIEGELVAQLAGAFSDEDAPQEDVAVVFANAADSYPHVQDALVREGVPFDCRFSVPVRATAFGAAFLALLDVRDATDDKERFIALMDLAASPYAGVEPVDARALQMRWRMRAASTHDQRMRDVRNGFAQGNADASTVRARLEPLAALLDCAPEDAVRSMFDNARSRRGAQSGALVDDARAAQAILDYLDEAARVQAQPQRADIAQLPVALERAFYGAEGERAKGERAEDAPAVHLISAGDLALQRYSHVVLANLDAQHHPMAQRPGAFDDLLRKLGVQVDDVQALRERCLLLDCICAARNGFGFYRVCHDREGSESCQSALWDELVATYADPATGGGVELPRALEDAGAVVRLAEAQVFARGAAAGTGQVVRGKLGSERSAAQLAQYSAGDAIPFSPTSLEDYYRCPYRWFASRRVGYNGMDNAFSASAQGNLAHGVFDAFYRALHAQGFERVTPQNLPQARELVQRVFDEYVERGLDKPRTGLFIKTEMDRLALDEVREQVLRFVERDAEFLPGFAPTYFELELGRGTGSTLMYAGVPVRGKVDRIDVAPDGRAVIVDYKLSKLGAGYGFEAGSELPGRIQTDIYAMLVQRHFELLGEGIEVVGSVYRSYSANMLRGVYAEGIDWGVHEQAKPRQDALPGPSLNMPYADYLQRVESEVERCVGRLVAGDIEPRPLSKGVCEYCRALPFCPRREA